MADAGKAPVVIVVGALAPYTQVLYERLAQMLQHPLRVLACSARETARQWEIGEAHGYAFEVLPGLRWHRSSVTNHYLNPSTFPRLLALSPAAVVLNDFSPTMLTAAAAARLRRIPYGIRTDGVPETDPGGRSATHRLLRRAIIGGAKFGLGPSRGSERLLASYGLKAASFAMAPLFPAWPAPKSLPEGDRPFDVLFCGMLNDEVKGAGFFTEVMVGVKRRGRNLRVRVAGDGPLRSEMASRFAEAGISAQFDGFLQQSALAEVYASANLFHFPSRGDVWGIVVQEALQCGTPVVASPHSGVARELVAPYDCGRVVDLELDAWVETTIDLFDRPQERVRMREAARPALADFSLDRAASAYVAALEPFLH